MNTRHFTLRSLLALLVVSTLIFGVTSCFKQIQDHQFPNPTTFSAVQGPPVAAGLKSPIGLAEDNKGYLWVTEAGSGTVSPASGQVSVITPGGTFTAITGFLSAESPEGSPEGLNHLAYKDGKLYILHGVDDALYIADISSFVPGVTAPMSFTSLTKIDIGTFVRQEHPNAPDDKDSNPYNLTFGPDGDLFIVDAGGNAIVRRNKDTGVLSIYAIFPDVPNPTYSSTPPAPDGPPTIDPVPTGIAFNGTDFLVTTLVGYPFPDSLSTIYKVSATGSAPITPVAYKTKFSGLTDIALTSGGKALVTEFGFSTPPRVANGDVEGDSPGGTLFSGAFPYITPVDVLVSNTADTYYVLYYGSGMIIKFTGGN